VGIFLRSAGIGEKGDDFVTTNFPSAEGEPLRTTQLLSANIYVHSALILLNFLGVKLYFKSLILMRKYLKSLTHFRFEHENLKKVQLFLPRIRFERKLQKNC